MDKQKLKDAIKAATELKNQAQSVLNDAKLRVDYYNAVIDGLQTALDGNSSDTLPANKSRPPVINHETDNSWA